MIFLTDRQRIIKIRVSYALDLILNGVSDLFLACWSRIGDNWLILSFFSLDNSSDASTTKGDVLGVESFPAIVDGVAQDDRTAA